MARSRASPPTSARISAPARAITSSAFPSRPISSAASATQSSFPACRSNASSRPESAQSSPICSSPYAISVCAPSAKGDEPSSMKNAALRLARALASRRTFGLVLLAALVLLRIGDPYWLQELRLRSFDLYQKISPRAYSESSVVIVDIDEDSLSTYGQWPWPRTLLADLLTRLYEWQVAAIGFC